MHEHVKSTKAMTTQFLLDFSIFLVILVACLSDAQLRRGGSDGKQTKSPHLLNKFKKKNFT